jgi:hypothetical protein
VVCHGLRFSIKEERVAAYLVPGIAQRLAMKIARWVAEANQSSLIVQGRRGRIRLRSKPNRGGRNARARRGLART